MSFPGGASGKEPGCNVVDANLIPRVGKYLEEEVALAWKIPRTEEPSGLQSIGLPRVEHG